MTGKPGEFNFRAREGLAAASRGRMAESRELFRRSANMALRNGLKQVAAESLLLESGCAALAGSPAAGRSAAREALDLDRAPETLSAAAFALAVGGDVAGAQAVLAEAEAESRRTDTMQQAVAIPRARAALALARKAPAQALEALRPAAPYERGRYDVPWLRGEALLALGRGREAAEAFRLILDHPWWEPGSPLSALARARLARAAALSGDAATARRAYEDFLAAWKDADPDVPLLAQVRAEYAKVARAGSGATATSR